ncbi:MAG: CrcB family protein [Acetobacteraceae bacterium]|nr:CrcB family protein [Acetobacteraceae bacterium]MCX7684221.1 CrcB family protein [Acetobacteraceae bacterium]MDW8398750.1 CrcB family protein [Acetobacteraceae bacterium]
MNPASPLAFALVMLGGALGSAARYGAGLVSVAWFGAAYPWSTLAVNILGSALIGIAAGLGVEGGSRLLLVTGFLGGFTTFSAFSLETASLWERSPWLAAFYVAGSVGFGIAAFLLARRLVAG